MKLNEENINRFDKTDGIFSIIYYLFFMIVFFICAFLSYKYKIRIVSPVSFFNYLFNKYFITVLIWLMLVLPVFIFIKLRKQSIKSVGITSENLLGSLPAGLIGALPVIVIFIILAIIRGKQINYNIISIFKVFLYHLFVIAFAEELAFRGFIQTRILTIIKNKWFGIIITALLFSLFHVPFRYFKLNSSFSPLNFIIHRWFLLLYTFLFHIYFLFIYSKKNNIAASIVTHGLINFTNTIFGLF